VEAIRGYTSLTQLDQGTYREYMDDTLPELGQEIKQHGRRRLA
jgi:hypothetical protein